MNCAVTVSQEQKERERNNKNERSYTLGREKREEKREMEGEKLNTEIITNKMGLKERNNF